MNRDAQPVGESATSDERVSCARRRFLVRATSVVGAMGVAGAAVPLIASWAPGAGAKAASAPVRVNVAKLESGQQLVVQWRGQPVFVLRRGQASVVELEQSTERLADPESTDSLQPDYVDPRLRSIRAEILVVVGICTHLGCSPQLRSQVAAADLGPDWPGGYFCPCHGSRYDLAGRVYKGQPAPLNLAVPPHSYASAEVIVIGVDPQEAA